MTLTQFTRSHEGLEFGKWPPSTTHTHKKREIIDTTFFNHRPVQTGGGHTFSSENTGLVIQRSFKTAKERKNDKQRSNLISPFQIRKNITVLKIPSQYQKYTHTSPDDTHYRMIKYLHDSALDTLFTYHQCYLDNRSFSRKLAFGNNYTYS